MRVLDSRRTSRSLVVDWGLVQLTRSSGVILRGQRRCYVDMGDWWMLCCVRKGDCAMLCCVQTYVPQRLLSGLGVKETEQGHRRQLLCDLGKLLMEWRFSERLEE